MFEAVLGNEKPLVVQVADRIIEMITGENLVIGEKLPNEFELAEEFNVGRGTVREAVKLLVSRNILVIRRGKGTFVSSSPGLLSDPLGLAFYQDKYKLALDLIEIRSILEPEIAASAAKNATQEEINKMWKICDEIEHCEAAHESYIHHDIELHKCIAQSTRNLVMPNLIPIIAAGIELFNAFPYEVERLDALKVHRDLIDAIQAHDENKARLAMQKHLSYNKRSLNVLHGKF
jgi:Transcriptional regulators